VRLSPTLMQRWESLRIVTLGVGTARQRMVLGRWTNPKPQRRTLSPQYGVPSCRRKSTGVPERPRERFPTRNPYHSQLLHRCAPPAESTSRSCAISLSSCPSPTLLRGGQEEGLVSQLTWWACWWEFGAGCAAAATAAENAHPNAPVTTTEHAPSKVRPNPTHAGREQNSNL
jgi:hypothetical protein